MPKKKKKKKIPLKKLAWRYFKYFRFSYRTPYQKKKLSKEIKKNSIVAVIRTMESFYFIKCAI